MTSPTPARRRARLLAGLVAGTALAVAAPLAAAAHVHVNPGDAPAGASTRLDFSFSHGCDGAATTALVIDIPDIVDGVTPILDGAWTIARELGADGIPTRVVYTAAQPIEDGLGASVAMNVIFPQSAAGSAVAFPVLQECATGAMDWSEIAEEGQDPHDLDAPAPLVQVGDAVAADAHGHGDAADAADAADASDEHGTADAAAADPVARWLAGGALAIGAAALAVTLLRRRAA